MKQTYVVESTSQSMQANKPVTMAQLSKVVMEGDFPTAPSVMRIQTTQPLKIGDQWELTFEPKKGE